MGNGMGLERKALTRTAHAWSSLLFGGVMCIVASFVDLSTHDSRRRPSFYGSYVYWIWKKVYLILDLSEDTPSLFGVLI